MFNRKLKRRIEDLEDLINTDVYDDFENKISDLRDQIEVINILNNYHMKGYFFKNKEIDILFINDELKFGLFELCFALETNPPKRPSTIKKFLEIDNIIGIQDAHIKKFLEIYKKYAELNI